MTSSLWHSSGTEAQVFIPEIGLAMRARLHQAISDGAVTIIDTINAPGFGPPLHRHREAEIFRVLTGRYLFQVDDTRFYAKAGDVVHVPRNAAHAFLNVADTPAELTVTIVPGMDAASFFLGLGAVMTGGQADMAALNAFGLRWGMEFLGPPLTP